MELSDIIQIIERRQSRFRSPSRTGSQEPLDEASRLIAEEYDSLLAEIKAFRKSSVVTAPPQQPEDDDANQIAEAEILGDQGQSGG